MRRCEEISRRGSPHSTARGWQSSGARVGEAEARAMIASTSYTCNLYPREVSSRLKPSFIPFGPRTSSGTERFQSRDANLAHPSVATPLPWHHLSRKRPVSFHREPNQLCPGDIQLAYVRRRASRRHGGWFAGEEVSFTEMVEKRTHRVR